MVDYKLIGSRLKEKREASGMTQEAVAEKVDITVVYLSKIENGRVRPTLNTLSAVCGVLCCDLGEILLNISTESNQYQSERVIQLFNSCKPEVKPVALELLRQLAKL